MIHQWPTNFIEILTWIQKAQYIVLNAKRNFLTAEKKVQTAILLSWIVYLQNQWTDFVQI